VEDGWGRWVENGPRKRQNKVQRGGSQQCGEPRMHMGRVRCNEAEATSV
jgi:hypothetical protein